MAEAVWVQADCCTNRQAARFVWEAHRVYPICFWRLPGRGAFGVDALNVRREPAWLFGRIGLVTVFRTALKLKPDIRRGRREETVNIGSCFWGRIYFLLVPAFGR